MNGAAPERLGYVGDVGELDQRGPRHHLLGQVRRDRVPRREDLGGPLVREEHRAGVQLGDRVDLELDRGDDAEVAVAAAQRPEQVRLVLGVDAPDGDRRP